jgi:hypothetical protein
MWINAESSSSPICHAVGPSVDPFRSHVSRSPLKGLPWFLLPVTQYCFITLGSLLRGILLTCCIQFLLYSSDCAMIKTNIILQTARHVLQVIFANFSKFYIWSDKIFSKINNRNSSSCPNKSTTHSAHGIDS